MARLRHLTAALCFAAAALAARAQTSAPTISAAPRGTTANVGSPATFSVTATGGTLSYQWEFNGAPIGGATASTYSIASVIPANGGFYSVLVSNSVGSTLSTSGGLTVYNPYVVTTLAGTALTPGAINGTGSSALFDSPQGIAVDGNGNVYVADTANSVIRKIAPTGAVSTFAGTAGVTGSADGTGPAAQFNFPTGIAVDNVGNLYVADTFNSTIRKITPQGVVTTIAGTAPTAANPAPENTGSGNGIGANARFNYPRGVAVDAAGTVYVADTLNCTIREITPTGTVTTLAGSAAQSPQSLDGTGTAALFDYPFGIACDSSGNLYIADTSGQTIRSLSPATLVVTTIAGLAGNSGTIGGPGGGARFNGPAAIAVDVQHNIYIADTNNSTIREITTDGVVSTLAGVAGSTGATNASGSSARLFNPYGIAVDGAGNLYIADTIDSMVRTASAQSPVSFAPTIVNQPQSQTVVAGGMATFSVTTTGNPAPVCQWTLAGAPLPGATGSVLTLPNVQPSQAGVYAVLVSNSIGSVTSNNATLTVTSPPVITAAPQGASVSPGATVTLSVTATGATKYQWQFNAANISGATSPTLTLANIGTNQAGTYDVVLTNTAGTVTSTAAVVAVAGDARLTNLSARANVGTGTNVLIAGFVISGSASKNVLLRGIGPDLANFSVSNPLAHPVLTLEDVTAKTVATDVGWGNSPAAGSSPVVATIGPATATLMAGLGAFALPANSPDCAMLAVLPAGNYSIAVSGAANSTGIGMAEIYDADPAGNASRLADISARANVGVGPAVLVAGFEIAGTTSETILIRGVGPGLGTFGLSGFLARPTLTLISAASGATLATNSGWAGSASLAAVFNLAGAFSLSPTSADAALVITLPPGGYTAELSGVNNTTGLGLLEVYEVP